MTGKVVAILLAAGFSSRMHSFKPLLPLGGGRVIEKPIQTLMQAGIKDIRVVVGHNADALRALLKDYNVRVIYNEQYATGMFSSITAGVSGLEKDVAAFFIWPADIPLVQVKTIQRMLHTYKGGQAEIIYPCYRGVRGHPPLISAKYKKQILAWPGSGGLRVLLNCFVSKSVDLAVPDKGVTLDMDTEGDYDQIISCYYSKQSPTTAECMEILNKFCVSSKVINHGVVVAQLASHLANQLNQAGCHLDIDLINAAALLHDVAKGQPNHADTGAKIIKRLGYDEVAAIVACHNDIELYADDFLTEAEIVYLADKLVKGDRVVSLEERFKEAKERYAHSPEIMAQILIRQQRAVTIDRRIKDILSNGKVETWNIG
ncbi:NTP transferase domain-containing protein [Peptococcaceae bacterium 1198_IL3148]